MRKRDVLDIQPVTGLNYTVESRSLEHPMETKIGSRNQEFEKSKGYYSVKVKQIQGKRQFVRVIGRFEKSEFYCIPFIVSRLLFTTATRSC